MFRQCALQLWANRSARTLYRAKSELSSKFTSRKRAQFASLRRADHYPHFDVCIIGGGPGGVAAALHTRNYENKKVCIVEANRIGGVDVWNGGLQSKFMWEVAHILSKLRSSEYTSQFINPVEAIALSNTIDEERLRLAMQQLCESKEQKLKSYLSAAGVVVIEGEAMFANEREIDIHNAERGDFRALSADYFIIATGAKPSEHSLHPSDHNRVITSDDIFSLPALPKSMVIIGAGPLGCEFAAIYSLLGKTKVNLIDKASRILPNEDEDIALHAERRLIESGVRIHHDCELFDLAPYSTQVEAGWSGESETTDSGSVDNINKEETNNESKLQNHMHTYNSDESINCGIDNTKGRENAVNIPIDSNTDTQTNTPLTTTNTTTLAASNAESCQYSIQHRQSGDVETFNVERAFVSVGRESNYIGLGLENTAMRVKDGQLMLDEYNRCIPYKHIYCIGDAGNDMKVLNYAHSAARMAIDDIYKPAERRIPSSRALANVSRTIFLHDEVSAIGLNEIQCQTRHIAYIMSKVSYKHVTRATLLGEDDGFVKLLVSNDERLQVLGVRAVGCHAGTIVEVASLAVRFRHSVHELLKLNSAYPSVVHGLVQCARLVVDRSLLQSGKITGIEVKEWTPESYSRGRAFTERAD